MTGAPAKEDEKNTEDQTMKLTCLSFYDSKHTRLNEQIHTLSVSARLLSTGRKTVCFQNIFSYKCFAEKARR